MAEPPPSKKDRKQRAIGLILARGGSKGIKLKNIKRLAGRPLLYWTMHALRDSGVTDEIWVSTDHDEIASVAREGGALVHRRGPEVSHDTSTSVDAMLEFLKIQQPQCDILVLAQATCPCIKPAHFKEMMEMYEKGGYDSVFTVVRLHLFRWQEAALGESSKALNLDPYKRPRRQDWKGELFENGAIYITRKDLLADEGILQGGKVGHYEMQPHLFVDIDVPDDWPIAEDRVRKYGYNPDKGQDKKRDIKLLVSDADGTLTDGQAYIADDGHEMRSYSSTDSAAIWKIKQLGVDVRIVTASRANAHVHRAKQMGCLIASDCKKKLEQVDEWRQELKLDWSQVAFIGDDFFDLECIKQAGVGAAPANANPEVLCQADYVTPSTGGNGAVKDFCNYLIEQCHLPGQAMTN